MFDPGSRVGPYEITATVRLGTGEAYRAYDHEHRREVLLQVFGAEFDAHPGRLSRFERDVWSTTTLAHPNILDIYDISTDAAAPYIVSEPLTGDTLRARLDARAMPLVDAARCAVQIARALLAARRRHVRHGHLSADNVAFAPDGRVVVLGFGLASLAPPERVVSDLRGFAALVRALLRARPPAARVGRRVAWTAAMLVGLAVIAAMLTSTRDVEVLEPPPTSPAERAGSAATPSTAGTGDTGRPADEWHPSAQSPRAGDPARRPDTAAAVGDRSVEKPIAPVAPIAPPGSAAVDLRPQPDAAAPSGTGAAVLPPPAPAPPIAAAAAARPLSPVVADGRDAASLMTEASVRATEFDLAGAAELLKAAAGRGDASARVAALYIGGLIDAREAFREGGPADALAPVRQAIAALEAMAQGRPGSAEIARLTLHAAAAAAQSERDEMSLYLETALEMESLQQVAGLPGAPLVSAAEVAGDLWLQVHRYDDARRAYTEAADRVGATLRILSGLARTARRLNDAAAACASYRRLLDAWGERPGLPVEIAEARAYIGGCAR
ncbi:MAG: protein kinase [Acidobacteria bacterium]|nr:protein kinase [Acidobacteriota bacterium]